MNAAETIAAAIEKLERWRAEVDIPPMVRWFDQEHIAGWDGFIVIGDSAEEGEDCNPVARVYTEELAEMLAGLHRTIDAQIAILRAELAAVSTLDKVGIDPETIPWAEVPEMVLALAVLGGDS
jgi:hypothetical protein